MKILVDLGHGGKDSGAVNGSLYEKNVVLEIGKELKKHLDNHKCEVKYTRLDDKFLTLRQRSNMSKGYDFALSIHNNASTNKSAKGFQTYIYTKGSKKSLEMANKIQSELDSFFPRTKWSGVKRANLHMVRETKCPAVLVECGFISNKEDKIVLQNQINDIAHALARGLVFGLNIKGK